MRLRFLYIFEGSSDRTLSEKLAELCVLEGADEAEDVSPDLSMLRDPPGHRVEDKLAVSRQLEPHFDLAFVHRDEDGEGPETQRAEIANAASRAGVRPTVPVVPVVAIEAWLLMDERAIRRVASRPGGRAPLSLPPPRQVEQLRDPKSCLKATLLVASEARGRERERAKKLFGAQRGALIRDLDLNGPVRGLPAFQALVEDLREVLKKIAAASGR